MISALNSNVTAPRPSASSSPAPVKAIRLRRVIAGCFALAIVSDPCIAGAQESVRIGLVMPMTGALASNGREAVAAAKLYIAQHGDTVAGRKIELIVRDDASIPDNGKRLAQELIVNDKVNLLGAGVTPTAMSMAPIVTQAEIATVVMISGTSAVTERSPYYVRTSFTLGQQSGIIADWALQNGSKRVVSIFSDFAPGAEADKVFEQHFEKGGGNVLDTLKVPLANPDFAPFLQRARDSRPDTLFVFLPAGQSGPFTRQFVERGLDKTGIKLIGTGDIVDDDDLPNMGGSLVGVVTAGFYSAAHASKLNQQYVADYQSATGHRANYISVGGYDGHAPHLRSSKKDWGQDRRESVVGRDERYELGKPSRSDIDRSTDSGHRPEYLRPQG
jgi:branched-chain amino acid transport system substrate-binding protein